MRPENRVSIGSGNSLSPVRHQAITGSDAELLSIGANFSEIQIKIQTKMGLEMSSAKWRPFCPGGWVDQGVDSGDHLTHDIVAFTKILLPCNQG